MTLMDVQVRDQDGNKGLRTDQMDVISEEKEKKTSSSTEMSYEGSRGSSKNDESVEARLWSWNGARKTLKA